MPSRIFIEHADRALGVTGEFEDAKGHLAERDGCAARNREGRSDGDLTGIQPACDGPCSGGGHDVGQCLPVIGMSMGRQYVVKGAISDEGQQPLRFGCGIDHQRGTRGPAPEQVGIVVVWPHGDLADDETRKLSDIGRASDRDSSVIHSSPTGN